MAKRIGFIFYIIISITIFSCKNSGTKNFDAEFEIPDSVYQGELQVTQETMSNVIENISSPVEMAALMLDLGVPYSSDYIATTKNADSYTTSFKKAIALGVFGADLGYLNMYNKTSVVMDYITTIRGLANGIKVGQFFDFSTLKRLVSNKTNLDSLMLISQQSFNNMDEYLRENNRSSLSTLIVTGTWIEGMYLATQIIKDNPHKEIKEAIGDQKTIVSTIHGLVNNYRKDEFFKSISQDFRELQSIYEGVKITIEVSDPKPVEVNGVLVFESDEKSIVNIPDETLDEIIQKLENMRNKIISVQK